MGSCFSSVDQEPSNEKIDDAHQGKKRAAQEQAYVEPANMAKDVIRCSDLLRQMYALDIHVWGMEECVPEEIPKREEEKRRANALFGEITRTVDTWRLTSGIRWSDEERKHVENIGKYVDSHRGRRH